VTTPGHAVGKKFCSSVPQAKTTKNKNKVMPEAPAGHFKGGRAIHAKEKRFDAPLGVAGLGWLARPLL